MADDTGAAAGHGATPREDASPDGRAAAERLEALEATVAELEDRWRRALAELDNARKRHARELNHEAEAERRRICLAWLPIVDNLELALEHAKDDPASIIVGVRAVRDQAVALLASLGYPRDDETGVPFDPLRHEAAEVVEDPGAPPGTVVRVLRPGYGSPPDRQLRPAAVAVSRKRE
ncbi:MAG TPA: nucleotide exchange factor GrpE [Actinospica sp.]|jgi:molecular chaperone GrpE|nr:nucleotide exchange factor GrpE [Actinospica sp.]